MQAQLDDNGIEKVIKYASCQQQGPEKHTSITEKECLSFLLF